MAALRHQLWDLNIVIRRSLVYGVLTASIVTAYVLAIVTLGGVIGSTTGAPLLATAVVAVGVAPLRIRLQRLVDKRLYGDRADPAAAVRRLARHWESEAHRRTGPTALLDEMAHDVSRGLRLSHVRISTPIGVTGSAGVPHEPLHRVPLLRSGVVVGELVAGAREPGRPLSRRDEATLREVAAYAAVVVHALRLTDDLQRSRERIVVAREEERRRLRRDLHDGLGPELAAIALRLETVRDLADGPHTAAGALAESLRAHLRRVVGDVRRIVDDLRPPVLDDLGLAEAVRQQAERFAGEHLHVTVDIEDLPPLSAAVEVAVLRIVGEALTNVSRHSGAAHCAIRVAVADDLLELSVIDDGCGIAEHGHRSRGVGLTSMRERALELAGSCSAESLPSGHTTVRALLPITPHAVVDR